MTEPIPDVFEFIGQRIFESLSGKTWHAAWLKIYLVELNVARRSQRFRTVASGPEFDFRLVDPIGVVRQVQALRAEMEAQGHPKWHGLLFRTTSTGEFQFEYLYETPPPL